MRYFAIRCKNCGHWGSASTNKIESYTFRCYACNYKSKLKKANSLGLDFDNLEVSSSLDLSRTILALNGNGGKNDR